MDKSLMIAAGFEKEVSNFEKGLCANCGEATDVTSFKDKVSVNEYLISGLCQPCQDKIFKQRDDGGDS